MPVDIKDPPLPGSSKPEAPPLANSPHRSWGSEAASALVTAIYHQILERDPDSVGMIGWGAALAGGGMTVREVVRSIGKSEEYKNRFVLPWTPEHAVTVMYRHFLGRGPDADGLRGNTKALVEKGYQFAIDIFVDSQEYKDQYGEDSVPHNR